MSPPRTPANFPRMKHRARKRTGARVTIWDENLQPVASTHTRFRPGLPQIGKDFSLRINSYFRVAADPSDLEDLVKREQARQERKYPRA